MIIFEGGVRAEDIRVSRDYHNLYLTNKETGDRISVNQFFTNLEHGIESVEFADGTVWTREELLDKARYYYGTEGRDEISSYNPRSDIGYADSYLYGGGETDRLYGNDGNDELYGEAGNDTLEGRAGDDLLVGGTGNDLLKGGEGNDTYRFNLGDGQDTVQES
ncbi:MAG: hypothetical protein NC300_10970, partial [Bacteroidales bacterium]|nr:hypothetical protein [Clostridium sp.]MCM1204651.1 hypothetical protein [Bacteroidales bacterium]